MPVPSVVLVLFMVHLKELLTHGILPDTNAVTTHALSCQTVSGRARPKQAHLAHGEARGFTGVAGSA